jgi:hypothetical protein
VESRFVPGEHRALVAAALSTRIAWTGRWDPDACIAALHRNGAARFPLHADGTPFELNINARISADYTSDRLVRCFSVSVKFGRGRDGKVCVARLDGQSMAGVVGSPWHIHPFSPEAGQCLQHSDPAIIYLRDAFAPKDLNDAIRLAVPIFCVVGDDDARQTDLFAGRPATARVPLVVR